MEGISAEPRGRTWNTRFIRHVGTPRTGGVGPTDSGGSTSLHVQASLPNSERVATAVMIHAAGLRHRVPRL